MKIFNLNFIVFFFLVLSSCGDDSTDDLESAVPIDLVAPDYLSSISVSIFNVTNPNFAKDVNQMIHLGRVLFYDKALSVDNTVSCATCHRQEFAFADPFKHSIGIASQLSERNTPSIINTGFGSGLFWDQRAANLRELVLQPIMNHRELGFTNFEELISKLDQKSYYDPLFSSAFYNGDITQARIAEALTAFCGALTSFDSDLDLLNGSLHELDEFQTLGMNLFESNNCNSCHKVFDNGDLIDDRFFDIVGQSTTVGYTGASQSGQIANIGLNNVYKDKGVGALSKNTHDNGKFKIPTLRNVAITPPYMHDGRFNTLEEVLEFYNSGVNNHDNLDSRLKENDLPMRMNMTEVEKEAIIEFLNLLTSDKILSDPILSNPFVK